MQASSVSKAWSFKTYMYSDVQLLLGSDDALPPCLEEAWCLPALSKLPRAVDAHVSCGSLAAEYTPAPGCPPPGLLTLHVSKDMLAGGTGCHEWEAGLFLAEWVLSNSAMFQGQHSSSVRTQTWRAFTASVRQTAAARRQGLPGAGLWHWRSGRCSEQGGRWTHLADRWRCDCP